MLFNLQCWTNPTLVPHSAVIIPVTVSIILKWGLKYSIRQAYSRGMAAYRLSNSNSNLTFIALNLHLLMDCKVLDPSHIQSHSPLTICLIAVGGNRSTRRKPTLKSQWNPHMYIAMLYCYSALPCKSTTEMLINSDRGKSSHASEVWWSVRGPRYFYISSIDGMVAIILVLLLQQ